MTRIYCCWSVSLLTLTTTVFVSITTFRVIRSSFYHWSIMHTTSYGQKMPRQHLPSRKRSRGNLMQWSNQCLLILCQQRLWKKWTSSFSRMPRLPACLLTSPSLSATMSSCPPMTMIPAASCPPTARHCRRRCHHVHQWRWDSQAYELLRLMYQWNVLSSLGGYGKYLTAEKIMVGSFAVCTSAKLPCWQVHTRTE